MVPGGCACVLTSLMMIRDTAAAIVNNAAKLSAGRQIVVGDFPYRGQGAVATAVTTAAVAIPPVAALSCQVLVLS
jgi:hypothetical protein